MKNPLFCLVFCLFAADTFAQVNIEWEKSFGGSNSETSLCMANTPDGGYLVGAVTESNNGDVSGNHGYTDMWITKINSNGVKQWQKCLGGTDGDVLIGIDNVLSGGYILAGHTLSNGPKNSSQVYGNHGAQDIWVVKVDETGQIEWRQCYGGCDIEEVRGITETSDGHFVVVGGTYSDNTGDVYGAHGGLDAWIFKITREGDLIWQRPVGGSGKDYFYEVKETTDGNLVAVGLSASTDGDLSGVGNKGGDDLLITKLSPDGDLLWSKTYGGSDHDGARAVCQVSNDNLIVSGNTTSPDGDVTGWQGGRDAWVLMVEADGNLLWQKTFGGGQNETAFSLLRRSDNDFIFAAETTSSDGDVVGHHGGNDGWVVKFDGTGLLKASICLGGSDFDHARAVSPGTGNSVVVAASSYSSDGDVSVNYGASDVWVVKLGVPLGLTDLPNGDGLDLKLTPNPASNVVTVATNATGSKRLDVFDAGGKLLQSLETDQLEKSLQINALPAGVYQVRMMTQKGQLGYAKFVKS